MGKSEKFQREKAEIGKSRYLNKNCWLVKNLNYAPYKRCQYCELKFRSCLFLHYQIISLVLIFFFLVLSFLIEGRISELVIITVFTLAIIYGYFFNKSTNKIIQANFAESRANEALKELTDNLQQEVDKQTKELRAKAIHLEKLLQMRSQFLDIASHQLRTPISVIIGTLSMLKEGSIKSDQRAKFIDNMYRKGLKLEQIIDDILTASEMDTEKFEVFNPQPADIVEIVDAVAKDKLQQVKEKGLKLQFKKPAKPIEVMTSHNYLEQAIGNLVDNAVQYTTKGTITMTMSQEKDRVIIKVSDAGIGIPKAELPKLFKKFVRGSNAKEIYTDGSGLGLFIIKEIVEAHPGGKVSVESTLGKGSTFTISLPVVKE